MQPKSGRLSQADIFSPNETDSGLHSKRNGYQKEKHFRSSPSTTSLYGTDVVDENHRALVDQIARHLIYGSNQMFAINSSLLLDSVGGRGRGGGKEIL